MTHCDTGSKREVAGWLARRPSAITSRGSKSDDYVSKQEMIRGWPVRIERKQSLYGRNMGGSTFGLELKTQNVRAGEFVGLFLERG